MNKSNISKKILFNKAFFGKLNPIYFISYNIFLLKNFYF